MRFVGSKKRILKKIWVAKKVHIFFRSGAAPDFPEHFMFEGNLPAHRRARPTNA